MYHPNVNVNSMVQNVIQIKSGVTINVDVIAKIQWNIMCGKEIIFGIIDYICETDKCLKSDIGDSVITWWSYRYGSYVLQQCLRNCSNKF